LLAAFSQAGAKLAVVTAKDKLRKLLGHRMKGICFSSEKAAEATMAENGIENVVEMVGHAGALVYSAELSEFVLRRGREAARIAPPGPHVPLHHRLHPAQVRPRHRGAPTSSTR
jgi:phosphonoacetate hydrolase